MTSYPTVSVIMPAYNEADTIGYQLAALSRQEILAPLEVIVADNGSTDGTLEVVESWRETLPQLVWIVADSVRGPSHARNSAARIARGEVLAFCDSDDEVDPRWLLELVTGLSEADLVGGTLDTSRINSETALTWRDVALGNASQETYLPTVVTSNMAIRASTFRELGMFDEEFVWGHDHEFSYRAQLAGYTHRFVPSAVVHYRIKPSLRSLVLREYQDAVAAAHVYASYRDRGLPRRRVSHALKIWLWLLVHLPDLTRVATRGRWLRKSAGVVGRLVGSARYRVLYP
jgi:glycosyltransferase involved in cell wall biosynthesis